MSDISAELVALCLDADAPDDAILRAAAQLEPVQYDRLRDTLRKRLDIRLGVLDHEVQKRRPPQTGASGLVLPDAPEWSEPVDGAELLDALAGEYGKYVVMPQASRDACALWTLMTYLTAALFLLPLLLISSAGKRCGKSTLCIVLTELCKRALPSSNLTAAVLYRVVELLHPTFILDEADRWMRDAPEIAGVLNAGHSRKLAFVMRSNPDTMEPQKFDVFCCKAIAGIGTMADTLHDRAVSIELKRRAPGETVQRLRQDKIDLSHLRSQCARWAADHLEEIRFADPVVPDGLHDRATDNWRPLIAIAEAAGGTWPARARRAAIALSENDRGDDDLAVVLLADIRDLLARSSGRVSLNDLRDGLANMSERPWSEWKLGRAMTVHQLGRRLRAFGIAARAIRSGAAVFKGFDESDFADAFSRYLKNADVSVTELQPLENQAKSAYPSGHGPAPCNSSTVTPNTGVTGRIVEFPFKNSGCNDVTEKSGENEALEI